MSAAQQDHRAVVAGSPPCRSATTDDTVVAGAHVEIEVAERVDAPRPACAAGSSPSSG